MSQQTLDDVARLQETIADGRLENPVYRREQLVKLFKALLAKRESIQDAIVKDSAVTQSEAFVELYQTVSALKSHIDATSPTTQLAVEYSVAEGKDAISARSGLGIVVVEPQFHTLFFSIFSPLGAAIAAGNPVVLVVSKSRA
jgi:acyl-CoA reductase-like NAD-dependent aldehyde dehydrogenase